MDIQVIHADAPSVDAPILAALGVMYPRVFLQWNPRFAPEPVNRDHWQGRWEIWCELTGVAHPGAKHKLADGDEWNTDAQCWMRYLQTYHERDGGFAPADSALIVGLEMADTWSNRRFYEDHVEDPWERDDQARMRASNNVAWETANYFKKYANPIVGRHFNSGWRGKII